MFTYNCLNPISDKGLINFSTDYKKVENIGDADACLVRSAAMHDMELGKKLACIARASIKLVPPSRSIMRLLSNCAKQLVFPDLGRP